MAFSNTKPHMSLLLVTFMTCFILLLNTAMSADSVRFSYNRFPNNLRDITFQSHARVADGTLRLTSVDASANPLRGSQGQARLNSPIHLWEASTGRVANFETTFTFSIRRTAATPGDGLTFFLNPWGTPIPARSNGGNLGIFGPNTQNQFVAVEFDTSRNTWDPRTIPHLGVNINSVVSVQTATWNTANVPNGSIARVRITYSANTKELRVTLNYPNVSGSATSTLIYRNLDFTRLLPEWVQVGFSAATGDHVQTHQIHSWSFTSNLSNRSISEDIIEEVV